MIPDAAVEAAVRASYRRNDWGDKYSRKFIQRALEAAAPHILAQGWREGWDTAQHFEMHPNPYDEEVKL